MTLMHDAPSHTRHSRVLHALGITLGAVAVLWFPLGCILWGFVLFRIESESRLLLFLGFAIPFLLIPASLLCVDLSRRQYPQRMRRGRCPQCGYDLRTTHGCSECGWSRHPNDNAVDTTEE